MVTSSGQLPNITTHFVTVTRDMAWDWLSGTSMKNRKVYQATVSKYARKTGTKAFYPKEHSFQLCNRIHFIRFGALSSVVE